MNQTAECELCHGSGWKPAAATSTHPGGARVTRCDCRLQERGARLLAQARIPRRYEHCELGNFETTYSGSDSSLGLAAVKARGFVENYPLEKAGLLFVGTIGVGKTHLAAGIIRELMQKNVPCLFCDYRELLKEIQNSYNPSVSATEMSILRPVFQAEVLVLDELGAVKPSEWVWDTVSLILNTRYNDVRTTIITTNLADAPPAGAEPYSKVRREDTLGDRIGERMRSRLHEMCVKIDMKGKDFREVRSASFR